MHDPDFLGQLKIDMVAGGLDETLSKKLERSWRLQYGGTRRYVAKSEPRAAPESLRSVSTDPAGT